MADGLLGLMQPGPTLYEADQLRKKRGSQGLLGAIGEPLSYAPGLMGMVGSGLLGAQYLTGEKPVDEGLSGMALMTALMQGTKVAPAINMAWKTVGKRGLENLAQKEGDDEFLYHVTSKPNAQRIIESGLSPQKGGSLFSHGVYGSTSKGKAHLTERGGVDFWKDRVENMLFDKYDNPPPVAVLRIPKGDISKQGVELFKDQVGTEDANAVAWFIQQLLK